MTPAAVIAVAGEALTDMVPAGADGLFQAAPGGSPANVAVGLARLDAPVRMLARLGDDALGLRLREHLASNGVDLSASVSATESSSLAIVTVAEGGGAAYDFRVDGTADWQWTDAELADVLDDVIAVHVGSLAMILEPGASALTRLVERARPAATITYDPNARPLLMGEAADVLPKVEALVALADVVKASSEDLEWLLPGSSPEDVVRRWLGTGPALVVVTKGPDGVVAAGRAAGLVHLPGRAVEVVDTVGAGDSFMSALIAGLHTRGLLGAAARDRLATVAGGVLEQVLGEAIAASAITCTRQGADPPTAAELRKA